MNSLNWCEPTIFFSFSPKGQGWEGEGVKSITILINKESGVNWLSQASCYIYPDVSCQQPFTIFFSRVRVGFIFWFHPSRDPFMNESANPTLTPYPCRWVGSHRPLFSTSEPWKQPWGEGGCAKNRYLTPLVMGGGGGVSISSPWPSLPQPRDPRASTTWRVGMRGEMKRSKLFSLSLAPSFVRVGGIQGGGDWKKKWRKKW